VNPPSPKKGHATQGVVTGAAKDDDTVVSDFVDDDGNNTTTVLLFERLEKLLPDPIENEDDFKSAWDTLLEIHGRESVKINENQIPKSMEWKIATVVTRLLIHFDFLQIGIVDSPLF